MVIRLASALAGAKHELVLFGINRRAEVEGLLAKDPRTIFEPLLAHSGGGFTVSVLTNAGPNTEDVVARTRRAGAPQEVQTALDARWPDDVYSLAHIALPFAPEDPLYGGPAAPPSPGITLGRLALRGERGVLRISGQSQLRMHWNPFYPYVESRILDFMDAGHPGAK